MTDEQTAHGAEMNVAATQPAGNDTPVKPATHRYTLGKDEKLRHKSLVDALFRQGTSVYEFPLRLTWRMLTPAELKGSFKGDLPDRIGPVQMLITVPKKKRRHAVDRVLMRRRIREAYRLNRKELLSDSLKGNEGGTLSLAFVYIHSENLPYDSIERKMRMILKKLAKKLEAAKTECREPSTL